jgi:hypothetical protein
MKQPATENFILHMSDSIVRIQSKIEFPTYRRLMFRLSYANPALLLVHFLAICMIVFYLLRGTGEFFFYFSILFVAYLPVVIYRSAARNYKTSKMIHELASYEFTPEKIIVTGQSFNCTMEWRSLYKTMEVKGCFLLFANRQGAMIIPKSAFASEADIATVRQYAQNVNHQS